MSETQHNHSHDTLGAGKGGMGGKLLLSIGITSLTMIAEIIGGILTGSLALLSDAAHVFLDIFALALSYGAIKLAARAASSKHSFGFGRMKVLAAFINGATLLLVAIEIFRESVNRFMNPQPITAGPMLLIAAIGLAANLFVALVLRGHDHEDLNARAAFLHVIGDALASVGVIAAGVIIMFTGWNWVDSAASILIGIIILSGAWRVLKAATHILNEGAPAGAPAEDVSEALNEIPEVSAVHDVHVWTLDPGNTVLTAHVVVKDQLISKVDQLVHSIKEIAYHRFGIRHTTIQAECSSCGQDCFSPDTSKGPKE